MDMLGPEKVGVQTDQRETDGNDAAIVVSVIGRPPLGKLLLKPGRDA
jgi:hypothetical protein